MARLVPFVTDDPVTIVREVLLLAVDTIDSYNQSVPAAYIFQRDARTAVDVIGPVIERYDGFAAELRDYIENYEDVPDETEGITISEALPSNSGQDVGGDKRIVKSIITIIVQTRQDLDKFLEVVRPSDDKRFSRKKVKAMSIRLFQSSEMLARIEAQNEEIRRLIDLLRANKDFAQDSQEPMLDKFKSKLSLEAYQFWKGHVGQATWTDWDRFAQAYTALHGSSNTIDLKEIKEHLATNQGGNDQVDTMTLYAFIALTNTHGFPFAKYAEHLEKQKKELSAEARMEVAKMVMNLMDQFSSKEMQESLLVIEQLYDGINQSESDKISEKAKEWGVLRKASRMMRKSEKEKKHLWADKVDFARRSVSFFYQRYMVIWRVGQLERETLKDIDFPGKGRSKEFLAFYLPLDYVNFHYVRGLDAEKWSDGKPKVYTFLEELIKIHSKKKSANGQREPRSPQPGPKGSD